jgi:spore germination protein KA
MKFVRFQVGDVSQTKVIVAYVSGRATDMLINDIKRRIADLKATAITDSGNVAMLLDGNKSRFLLTCGSTEKVDKLASKLMAGRVAIIVDGSPFVLTIPFLFAECLQSADDYLHTPYYATFIRVLRLIAFVSAIFAPAVLCALVSYDYAKMPPQLYGIIAQSRKDIPLSFFGEVVVILLLFEILREVGVRMPRSVGDAVGIVGSIILGNTAVEAGIVSSVGVITVAFSAVCAFITPAYMYVIVIARIVSLLLAELFGIYGLGLSATVLMLMICAKNSFGTPYLFPLSPFDKKGMQDFVFSCPKKVLGRKELDE